MWAYYGMCEKIAEYIIKQVQENSIETGIQLVVGYEEIEKEFKMTMSDDVIENIIYCLELREELADVETEEYGFDVVILADYAPNYDEDDWGN